jgi:hypothetical protein
LDNIIQNPDEPKFQKIRCSNKVFQEKVAPILGAAEFLRAANFDLKTIKPDPSSPAEEFWVFSPGDNMESSVSMLTVSPARSSINYFTDNEFTIIALYFHKTGASRHPEGNDPNQTRVGSEPTSIDAGSSQ